MNKTLAALLVVLAAAAPAAAAAAYATDPRIELLGVLQLLSGDRPALPMEKGLAERVEADFGRFRSHPAVARWRAAARSAGKMDGRAVDLLYFSDPPELAPLPGWAPPYLDDPVEAAEFKGFLAALRDFAKRSDFMDFYEKRRREDKRIAAAAAEQLGVKDPLGAVQDYVGLKLDAEARWIVSPLFVPSGRNAYITPYPDPQTLPAPGKVRFSVVTILAYAPGEGPLGDAVTQRHRAALWQEPLFVFIDPAMAAFDKALKVPAASFYGPKVAACRSRGADCAKNWLVAALSARLDAGAFGAPSNLPDGRDPLRDDYMTALSERLLEYEKDRKRWPTLWDFMPRLMSVFPEKAGLTPPPEKLPEARSVKDLFPGTKKADARR